MNCHRYTDEADAIIKTICHDRPLTDAEFLDLAMACLDQAGVAVAVQDKVRELLS